MKTTSWSYASFLIYLEAVPAGLLHDPHIDGENTFDQVGALTEEFRRFDTPTLDTSLDDAVYQFILTKKEAR